MRTHTISTDQKEEFIRYCVAEYGPNWMMEQFESLLFKDKNAFNALGLSMKKSRLSKNKIRMSIFVKDERTNAMLRQEGDENGRKAILETEGRAEVQQAATTEEPVTIRLDEKEVNVPHDSKLKIESDLKEIERENLHDSVSKIKWIRNFELITKYLNKFKNKPDFQLFDVKSYIRTYDFRTLQILGLDFKSFFDKQWLYAAAVDLGMKIQCSKFNKFDYVALNVYETQVLLGDIKVALDKTFITNIINREVVFCPILEHSHYSLFVIDFRHAVLYYLDSGKKSAEQIITIKENFLCKFIASLTFFEIHGVENAGSIVSKPWTVSGLNSETQNDDYNCGIYVIFNVFRILTWYEEDVDTQIVNADYRRCTYHLEVSDALIFPATLRKTCAICSVVVDVIDNSDIDISEFMCSTCLELIKNEEPGAFQTTLKPLDDNSEMAVSKISDKLGHKTIDDYGAFKKNVDKKKTKSYLAGVSWDSSKNSWEHLTSIKFEREELNLCYIDQNEHSIKKGKPQRGGWFDKMSYTTILRDKMNSFDRNCVYCVETQTHSKTTIIIYGYCGHYRPEQPCRLFKYVASLPSEDGLTFKVYVNQTEINHSKMLTEPCKGLAMQRLKEKTLQMPPKQLFHAQCNLVPDSVAENKNCTYVQPLPLIRWARHKALAENDLDKDPIAAVCIKFDESNGSFIKGIDIRPGLGIKMYSDAGHAVIHREIKNNGIKPLAHYDGTGGLFEYMDEFPNKDIQLLLLVIRVKNCPQDLDRNSVTIPVFYHITSDLHAITLQNGLESYYNSYMKKYPEDGIPFRGIVTDNSKGNIHALNMVFNKMNVVQYLNKMYCLEQETFEEKEKLFQDICLIYLCDAHLTKKQYKLVDESFLDNDSKLANIVKIIIANMYNITSYENLKKYWYNVCIFLLTDEFSDDYYHAYSSLKLNPKDLNELPSKDDSLDSSTYIDKKSDSQYKHSPFYNDVTKILRTAQQNIIFDSPQYESRLTFLETFSKRYLYLIPLWIPIFSDCVKDNPHLDRTLRKSNAPIEGKFSEFKQYFETISLTIGRGRKKLIRVINELEKDHFESANVHKKQIPMSGLRKRKFSPLKNQSETQHCSTPKKAKLSGKKRKADTFISSIDDAEDDKITDFLFVEDTFKRRRKTAYSQMQDTKLASTHLSLFDVTLPSKPPITEQKIVTEILQKSNSTTNNEDEASSIKDVSLDGVTLKRENVFYANRAFKDPEYYSNLNDDAILSIQIDFENFKKTIPISVKDFNTLMSNNWLSDSIIEAALMLTVRPFYGLRIISLSVHDSLKLFMESIEKVNVGKLHKFIENVMNHDIIVAPMMNDEKNHYLLAIIDLKHHRFYYFDSAVMLNEIKLRSILSSFKQCMNYYCTNGFINADKMKWKSSSWKIEQPDVPRQKDNHSCGIFVIHYAQQFLNFFSGMSTSEPNFNCKTIDPKTKRVEIQQLILENVFIDTRKCPICNMGDDISITMHYCEFCNRWVHYICDGREEITNSLPEVCDYICKTCSLVFKGHKFGKKIGQFNKIITI